MYIPIPAGLLTAEHIIWYQLELGSPLVPFSNRETLVFTFLGAPAKARLGDGTSSNSVLLHASSISNHEHPSRYLYIVGKVSVLEPLLGLIYQASLE
jgi:hypothetical protein